jgi:hypothetical protein
MTMGVTVALGRLIAESQLAPAEAKKKITHQQTVCVTESSTPIMKM